MALLPGNCTQSAFSAPHLLGAQFLSLEANLVQNYSLGFPIPDGWRYSQPSLNVQKENFCNITVSYTHPGQIDTVYVESWLPVENYNGRLQSIGGGGWSAGRFILTYAGMIGAVHDGYATATTDAGLGIASDPSDWALVSPGNTNLFALQNLGSVSLNDEAVIVKHFIEEYYGQPPAYSYWNGCSQGGRQGSMLAQRYPNAYNGIIAGAPALHWSEVMLSAMWPPFYMDSTEQYPNGCQLNRMTFLAIKECDEDDGVQDGIIADPDACLAKFNPAAHIGDQFTCELYNSVQVITNATVNVARALWTGPKSSTGKQLCGNKLYKGWHLLRDASPSSAAFVDLAFVAKELSANVTEENMSHQRFDHIYHSFKQQFDSLIGTNDPDYSEFKEAGGKIITYHGLADQSIPPNGNLHFYHNISQSVSDSEPFYRYFPVPGLAHCFDGPGGQPIALFDQLRTWVENGTAPESSPVTVTKPDKSTQEQLLCALPRKAVFSCASGQNITRECWSCR